MAIFLESFRQGLFIDMVVQDFIFENNLITPLSCFTFVPKTGTQSRNYFLLWCHNPQKG